MKEPVILVIEDQKSMADLLRDNLEEQSGLKVLVAYNYGEAQQIIESGEDIVVCITDLNLPDAEEGATVSLLQKHHITTVVLTANYTEETRQRMFKMRVADYVIKDGMAAIHYAVKTVVCLVKNAQRTIWILSEQSKNSKKLVGLLNIHRYRVSMFDDANALLDTLKTKSPDLLIINESELLKDFSNVKFIQKLRALYSQSQLPVLLCEEDVNITEIIKLMKYGINDFCSHKLTAEEFYVRVQMNLSLACSYKQIEKSSQTDPLTGLHNRRYFFEQAEQVRIGAKQLFAAMFDMDHFKMVNDNFGHDKGDEAIIFTAKIIQSVFKDFLVARFGGEEYCVYGEFSNLAEIESLCETVRSRIEKESEAEIGLPLTISIGLSHGEKQVDKLISKADKALYHSKESGRNQISISA